MKVKEYSEKYHLFTSACLNLTNQCCCDCKYCFVIQSNQSMNLQTAQAAITMVHDNLIRKRELDNNPNLKGVINYFGGEPMLEYDSIIVPLTIWIEETYPNDFNLGITTNGTLLTKERIDFLYDHNIVPLLSMDGDKKTQDYNRPCKNGKSSFDQIIPIIPYLLEKFPNTVFRMTIYEDTCDKLFDNILFAEKQGFKYFFATPDTRHNFSKENEKKLGIELEKFYTYLIGSLVQGVKPIESSFMKDMIIQALKEPSLEIKELDSMLPREIFRCGLGTTSVGIAPNGDIYGCQEQVTNKNSIFYIGDIFNGINEEKHHNLIANFRILMQIQSETPSKCLKCSYRKMCNDVECPSMAQFRFNNFFTVPNTLCFWRNKLFTLTKTLLQVYHPNIEKYLTKIVEQEESYELYNSRNRVS